MTSSKPLYNRFKELARDVECDEDETYWDERLIKIANTKPDELEKN